MLLLLAETGDLLCRHCNGLPKSESRKKDNVNIGYLQYDNRLKLPLLVVANAHLSTSDQRGHDDLRVVFGRNVLTAPHQRGRDYCA